MGDSRWAPRTRRGFAASLAATALTASALAGAQPAGRSIALFDGTFDGWTVENTDAGNFAVADGILRVAGPTGWLRSDRRYENFVLTVEFRFMTEDADSGIFVRAAGDEQFIRGWPNNSYQLQLRNPAGESRFPPVGGVFRHGMPDGETSFDPAVAGRASSGTGEWQTLEVEVSGSQLRARLNGTELTHARNIVEGAGYVGIQGELGELEFRSIELMPL